ncbi:phosphoglycerate mutase family protein [Acinetobacter larvae]|uniref:Phosphohistidine phosphatase n=1 Tax=Acinetobacter larvae TaxID=1789224 RepID=A0A1B2LYQ2_9GAMM|nr:phosphoglycerate mutase family protein [Acinetobacter larvae]AOA58074.1 phosphohistidine phosphatase [Acinetobacter larvae]
MRLTLVRHGEAAPAINANDSKRPLTQRGQQQAQQSADYIRDLGCVPDVLVVSPLLRAQQTMAYAQAYFPDVPVLVCDRIKPDDAASAAVEWLAQLPFENIVVFCHMNVVAHMEELLTTENFHPFALAEVRVYEQSVIATGLSTCRQSFIPSV